MGCIPSLTHYYCCRFIVAVIVIVLSSSLLYYYIYFSFFFKANKNAIKDQQRTSSNPETTFLQLGNFPSRDRWTLAIWECIFGALLHTTVSLVSLLAFPIFTIEDTLECLMAQWRALHDKPNSQALLSMASKFDGDFWGVSLTKSYQPPHVPLNSSVIEERRNVCRRNIRRETIATCNDVLC